MFRTRLLLLESAAIFSFAVSLGAQAADLTTPTKPRSTEDQASPPQAQTATPQQATRPGTTSDQLSQTRGVIQPPPTGDHAVIPPPQIGAQSTPVIPPPGTPGGNPEVQPK